MLLVLLRKSRVVQSSPEEDWGKGLRSDETQTEHWHATSCVLFVCIKNNDEL